ncbi:MAG: IMP dehydrogenase [Candidatus Thermoplasmatota archaeon]|jgi:IMP dehydrogenase|nr:IMP dehydrogenase [Candidatus Thermoplasmatota archaeon]MCL5785996.1 IMP dehydrogenase [Candidatus Thermoplasmatota archaeon]
MFEDKLSKLKEGLTFDDVLILPSRSSVEPRNADVSSKLTRNIPIKIPVVSSPMDTVTEAEMAIAMARAGGIGIIHRNLTANAQSLIVNRVKREESIKIRDVYTVDPQTPLREIREIMKTKKIAGMPVISGDKLVGIVTRRDLEFARGDVKTVSEVMVKDVISARDEIGIEEATDILYKHRIEKLPLVDNSGRVVGLITAKDIVTRQNYPDATRDEEGKLRVGAAVGPFDIDRAVTLEKEGADVIVVDTAHAHNQNVLDSIKKMRKSVDCDIIAGNIASGEAAEDLISLGVDGLRVGIGPGSICTTRIIAGVGVPQVTAIAECAEVAQGHKVPVVADGGIRFSGDIVKAIAAGASSIMLGSLLAGTEESPGIEMIINGRKYKSYRGMGSIGAINAGGSDRYGKLGNNKFVAEGVEGAVPYRGRVSEVIFQLMGGLMSGMGYVGSATIEELRTKSRFVRITTNGLRESHPHDIKIITEPPNYQLFQI